MATKTWFLICMLVLTSVALTITGGRCEEDLKTEVLKSLFCQCGCGKIVYYCASDCVMAPEWKNQIAEELAAGKTKDQVINGFVERYGEKVLVFALGSLIVDPSSVDEGGTVTISINVTNTGYLSGSHTITLKIDDDIVDEKTVTLSPDETETVSFEVSATQLGTFSVDVNGLISGSYTVVPEFPSFLILALFMIATLLAVIIYRRKHTM